ncbi:hypothetical protein GQ44DRAFT_221247 [Phaeosphaeriaceae sp. PMI808]|nr:hypothetical protein GQ44DRAFT_221247 [Phaeosphaeriaceae sp. PMI808]
MEIVASAASVTQLLGQGITLIQEIQQARETVHDYPRIIKDHSKQLGDLRRTLVLVEQEELQTSAVVEQAAVVHGLAQELESHLAQMAGWENKNSVRKYAHAMTSGKKDEKTLAGVLDRLDRTRNELVARILLAQVGLTGNLRDGFAAALPVVRRIDRNVQGILGSRMLIATHLGDRQDSSDGM